MGSLFCQPEVGSLFRQSLRWQVSGNPVESLRSERTTSSVQFWSEKIKIAVSLCAARSNGWQILTTVCSGGTFCFTVPYQVAYRQRSNGWYWRAARQYWVRIPVTDLFLTETASSKLANTRLKLCSEANCTICSVMHTGCYTTTCSASPCTDMPAQNVETYRQCWAILTPQTPPGEKETM